MTFLPPFVQGEVGTVARRKKVLDARWISGGRAILALLEDGEWGIWDLEAIDPGTSNPGSNLIQGQSNISGIQGGSLTRFAIRSHISPAIESVKTSANSQVQPSSGTLAPMTPSTRKIRAEGLFHGVSESSTSASLPYEKRGSIFVDQSQSLSHGRAYDEAVVISYAGEHVFIPSILAFWKSEIKPTRLPPLRLGNQREGNIALLPSSSDTINSSTRAFALATGDLPDFFIQTSHRLIFSVRRLFESTSPQFNSAGTQTTTLGLGHSRTDQALLDDGVLDVDGMDRILHSMDGDSTQPMNFFTKSVGFRVDEDDDMDMEVDVASPTPSRFSAPRTSRPMRQSNASTHRRLFS
jgi:hypothetical protein